MSRFCKNCRTVLSVQLTPVKFTFFCERCNTTIEPDPEDTRLIYQSMTVAGNVPPSAIEYMNEDPATLKVDHVCEACGYDVAAMIRVGGDTLRALYRCEACHAES